MAVCSGPIWLIALQEEAFVQVFLGLGFRTLGFGFGGAPFSWAVLSVLVLVITLQEETLLCFLVRV